MKVTLMICLLLTYILRHSVESWLQREVTAQMGLADLGTVPRNCSIRTFNNTIALLIFKKKYTLFWEDDRNARYVAFSYPNLCKRWDYRKSLSSQPRKKYFILLKVLNSRFLESSILFSAELRKYYYPLSPPPTCRHLLFQFGIVLLLNVCCSFQ